MIIRKQGIKSQKQKYINTFEIPVTGVIRDHLVYAEKYVGHCVQGDHMCSAKLEFIYLFKTYI